MLAHFIAFDLLLYQATNIVVVMLTYELLEFLCQDHKTALALSRSWTIHSHHISALIVDIILNTLRSHPPDGDLLLTSCLTLPPAEVVSPIHVFCETKVSYFDHSTSINPEIITNALECRAYNYSGLTCNFLQPGHDEQTFL